MSKHLEWSRKGLEKIMNKKDALTKGSSKLQTSYFRARQRLEGMDNFAFFTVYRLNSKTFAKKSHLSNKPGGTFIDFQKKNPPSIQKSPSLFIDFLIFFHPPRFFQPPGLLNYIILDFFSLFSTVYTDVFFFIEMNLI